MPVRTRKRQGRKTWVIDIRYEYNGKRERFRRDAQVQTALAARAEDRRRIGMLATTGLPFDRREVTGDPVLATGSAASEPSVKVEAPRFEDVVRDYLQQFAPSHLKPSTRAGYTDVINAHLLPTLRGLRLDEIDAKVVRAMDAGLAAKGRRPLDAAQRAGGAPLHRLPVRRGGRSPRGSAQSATVAEGGGYGVLDAERRGDPAASRGHRRRREARADAGGILRTACR
jgi:hypothetical protein